MKILKLVLLLLVSEIAYGDSTTPKSLVAQTIVYKTTRAKEMYLVWTINGWKVPEEKFWLPGTYINNNMAYSKMKALGDSFSITLSLPKGIYIDYMFWASKNEKGEDADGWDNFWGQNYNLYIAAYPKPKFAGDEKLAFVVKENTRHFSILNEGRSILFISLTIMGIAFIFQYLQIKIIKPFNFTLVAFITGLLISVFLIMLLIRLQMNEFIFKKQYMAFGAGFYDLLFLFVFSLFIFFLLWLTKKYKPLQHIFTVLSILLIICFLVFNLLNIEIVKQLGKPLNYNWLYYSDFLKAADAKNALRNNFNANLIINFILLITAAVTLAYAFALMTLKLKYPPKKTMLIGGSVLIFFLTAGYIQLQQNKFENAKIINPVYFLTASWINAESKPSLFTMKVPEQIKIEIVEMHRQQVTEKIPGTDNIKNIVLFVMESTPAHMVQVYDSTYQVTPNLNKWKKHAVTYTNMYAHLPNTVSSIFSITSGLYPMISYKSIITDNPQVALSTLPQLLKENVWKTSLFYSSDLTYGNIGKYITHHGFQSAQDYKTISCNFGKFESNYSQLEGLDDRCTVSRYLTWKDSLSEQKTFSMIWSNQTHYPYFSHDKNKYTDNAELNPYLNALKNVDEAFNQLMDGLAKSNSLNNTLVVVVGDHGEAFGTHNQYSHASKIYEENMHVPCLIINPVLFNGTQNNRISGLIDIAPTIMNHHRQL